MANPHIFDTAFIVPENIVPSYVGNIIRLMPNGTAPLFAMLGMVPAKTVTNIIHGYWTKSMPFPKITLTADLAVDTGTLMGVNEGIIPGAILQSSTGENMLVTEVVSETQLTTIRAFGQVPESALPAGEVIYQIGNAHEQGSYRPVAINLQPELVNNYTQIFRNSWSLTGTAAKMQEYVGMGETAESRQDCAAFHNRDIETAIFFGQKKQTVYKNQVMTSMDGIDAVIRQHAPQNIHTAGATTDYDQLENMLDSVFDVTSDPKIGNVRTVFTGAKGLKVINNIGRLSGEYQIADGQTSYGLQFKTFKTTRGTFNMVEHPILNSNPNWASKAFVIDLSSMDLAYMRQTSTKAYGEDGKPVENGADAIGGDLLTEVTTEFKMPSSMAVISNLTEAVSTPAMMSVPRNYVGGTGISPDMEQSLKRKVENIESAMGTIQQRNSELDSMQGEINEKVVELTKREQELDAKEKALAAQEQALASKNAEKK